MQKLNLRLTVLCAIVFGVLSACQKEDVNSVASKDSVASANASSTWFILFDGATLDGWVQVPANSWTVTNGAMASKGTGRGFIYSTGQYTKFRLIFSHRHLSGNPNHYGSVLIFNTIGQNTLGGIQFGLPNGAHWDYRKGHNNSGGRLFTIVNKPGFSYSNWSRVELLVDATAGTARMAVAQPLGTKSVEVLRFKDPTAGTTGPIAFQMHNEGLFDEYKDIMIRIDPKDTSLLTMKTPL